MSVDDSEQIVWTLTSHDFSHGRWLLGVYTDREQARLALVQVREREDKHHGTNYPITWEPIPSTSQRPDTWGLSDGRGTSYTIQPLQVDAPPRL